MRLTTCISAIIALFMAVMLTVDVYFTTKNTKQKSEYELNLIFKDICELKDNYTGRTYEVHPDSIPSFLNQLNR